MVTIMTIIILLFNRWRNGGTKGLCTLFKALRLANDVPSLLIQASLLSLVPFSHCTFYHFLLHPRGLAKNYKPCSLPKCCSGHNSRRVSSHRTWIHVPGGLGKVNQSCWALVYYLSEGNNHSADTTSQDSHKNQRRWWRWKVFVRWKVLSNPRDFSCVVLGMARDVPQKRWYWS